jgi:hypothetical protein
MKLYNRVNPFFTTAALSLWLTGLSMGNVNANDTGQATGKANEPSPTEPRKHLKIEVISSARLDLERAVQRALKGLQGEPLNIFLSNQTEWDQILAAETGVSSKLDAAANTNSQEKESVDLEYGAMLIKRRTSWIHGMMDHLKNRGDGLTGFWSDNRGGWMSLVDKNGVIYFSASCIRGRDHYHGHVRGHAIKNGKRAIFKDTPMDEEVKILFTKKGPWLRVEGTNTDVYHGLQAYFDGDYVKIAPLTPAKQKLVIATSKEKWLY